MFPLKKILSSLILPPLGPLLLIAAGLLLMRRRPRAGRVLAWLGVAAALAFVLPATVGPMLRPLEDFALPDAAALRSAQAIVVLGGGKRDNAPEYGGETINRLTLERVRYGARLARQTGLPILVTGGRLYGEKSEAELMREVLEQDFGVAVRWAETAARDTRENASLSAALLEPAGVRRVLLVSHAVHLERARAEFEAAGIHAIPAPTGFFTGPDREGTLLTHLPSANTAYAGWLAAHEWLGGFARRLGL